MNSIYRTATNFGYGRTPKFPKMSCGTFAGTFIDLGPNPVIYKTCEILRSFLIEGDSGWWLVDHRCLWRGWITRTWEETIGRISSYELRLTIPLELTKLEQHQAEFKNEKGGRRSLSKEGMDDVDLALAMVRVISSNRRSTIPFGEPLLCLQRSSFSANSFSFGDPLRRTLPGGFQ
jgi:hypothetical protein